MITSLLALSLGAFQTQELELKSFYRINSSSRFDLSGLIVLSDSTRKIWGLSEDFILVNDKDSRLFLGKIRGQEVETKPWIDLRATLKIKNSDLEAIDWFGSDLVVGNETDGQIIRISHKPPHAQSRLFQLKEIAPQSNLTKKFGVEGFATDGHLFWLAREMPPLDIFQISPPYDSKLVLSFRRSVLGSQTDLRFENKSLYILDRENRAIWRQQWNIEEAESKWSFLKTIDSDSFRYDVRDSSNRSHPEWSTAEALDLTDSEVYVGLDNNGEALLNDKKKKEDRPTILVFRRPK